MGICDSSSNSSKYEKEIVKEETYLPGEQYFNQVVDINPNISPLSNNNRDKVVLFFSLINISNPNLTYSFAITIINNVKLNILTFLGELENKTGKNIQFGKTFAVDYYFQREQCLIIESKINNNKTGNKKTLTLSSLIRSPGNKAKIYFEGVGELIINFKQKKARETPSQNQISSFQFSFNFQNQIFNKYNSGIFFVIYDGEKHPLYKSQEFFVRNNFIQSNIVNIPSDSLCPYDNKNSPIFLKLFCPPLLSKRPIGEAIFNLNNLEFNLNNDQLSKVELNSQKYGYLGPIQINYDQTIKLTFVDYLSKGMQINLDIAIDYTASNNENPIPLHNIDGGHENDYEKAIESCGSIIAFYDYDQLFPVYGFGGIPQGMGYAPNMVSHCFNVNFNEDPNIKGINNIIKAYRQSLGRVTLAGPTYFTPIIDKVISEIKYDLENNQEENHYYILLILTDGCINDMPQTCDKIVEASYLPLSIIIVGIGSADFSLMEILDGDEEGLKNSRGELRKRDIVQFVQFEDFKKNNAIDYGTDLTEEVLKEIPTQVEEYFEKCGKFYE